MRDRVNKVLILIGHMETGGAQRVSRILANNIALKGIKVTVIALTEAKKGGYTFDNEVEYSVINKYGENNKYFVTVRKLRKHIKLFLPDVVIAMGVPTGSLYAVPAMIGIKSRLIISERADPTNFRGKRITKILSHRLIALADGFIFQTADAKKYYDKILKGRGEIIPNPISSDLPEIRNVTKRKEIVAVGRLAKAKNHALLIASFAIVQTKHRDYKLKIYGDGNERENLEKQIDRLGLQKAVLLPGQIDYNTILNLIQEAEIFVLSSDNEGMPNALMEAMAMGLPSISTDCPCGGPRMLINNNVNGILVPVGDIQKMANAILYLIENKEAAESLGKEAAKIRNTLNGEIICEKWINYCNLIYNEKKKIDILKGEVRYVDKQHRI